MSKLLPYIFIPIIFFSFFATSPKVSFAQYGQNGAGPQQTEEEIQALANERAAASQSSGLFDLIGWVLSPLAKLLMETMGFITYLTGIVLNASIYYTIFLMSKNIGSLDAINVTWTVIRDVANMGFIFMLLYASIMTIIGKEKNANKLIVNMVIAAILVNFSLFFTKVVIDVANILALTFYDAIAPGVSPGDFKSAGLSNSITQALKAQSLWNVKSVLNGGTVFISVIMSTVALLVTAFVFLAISIMLIIRYVALIFVLILSPLMFLSMVFPGLKGYASKWSEALFGQAFFAPVYFMLTWVTLILIKGMNASVFADGNKAPLAEAFARGGDVVGAVPALINYAVIIIFLIATLIISKSVADRAGGAVKDLNKWALGKTGSATFGSAGAFGRTTIGRAGQVVADSEFLRKAAPTSRLARLALATGQKGASASFDARSSKAFNSLSSTTGVSFGKGTGDKGFAEQKKKEVERQTKIADSFKPTDLVVSQAENDLDEAKKIDLNAPGIQSERVEERSKIQNELNSLEDKKIDALRKGATTEEIKTIDDSISKANISLKATDNVTDYKQSRIDMAQKKVDELKGVSEDEARKRKIKKLRLDNPGWDEKKAKDEVKRLENERFTKMATLMSSGMSEKQAKEASKDTGWSPEEIESATSIRKKAYSKDIENPSVVSGNRIMFVGPIGKEIKEAALKIRKSIKDKKPSEKIAEEIAKQAKESKDDDASSGGSSPTTGGPGNASPSPAPGGSPSSTVSPSTT